jgi:putative ABC transport system permease protein
MLKLLGATRARILAAQALEFTALALILSAVAFRTWRSLGMVRRRSRSWSWNGRRIGSVVAATLAIGALVTLVLGLLGSLPALAARPARALRTL